MADKKISALTASTTPLAGTEVLPIVQGGSTVKVSVANLTAGRAVTALSAATTTGYKNTSAGADTASTPDGLFLTDAANKNAIVQLSASGGVSTFIFESGGAGWRRVSGLLTNGNSVVDVGNVVIGTAAKGIDFSANGGDILNQYDEGTFTATLTCTTGTITLNSGQDLMQYTRIGRMVYVSGQIVVSAISSPTGILTLGGLPFTVNGSLGELAGRGAITVVAEGVGITVNNVVGYFLTGGTTANIYKYAAGNTANMAADVTASSSFLINMWYVAA